MKEFFIQLSIAFMKRLENFIHKIILDKEIVNANTWMCLSQQKRFKFRKESQDNRHGREKTKDKLSKKKKKKS